MSRCPPRAHLVRQPAIKQDEPPRPRLHIHGGARLQLGALARPRVGPQPQLAAVAGSPVAGGRRTQVDNCGRASAGGVGARAIAGAAVHARARPAHAVGVHRVAGALLVDVYSLEGTLAEPTGRTLAEQVAALDKVTAVAEAAEV